MLPLSYTCLFFTCYHCATLISSLGTTIELQWSHTLCATIELYLSLLYVLPLCHTDLEFRHYHWATMISHFMCYHWATLISTLRSTMELHWSYTLRATIELHWSLLYVLPMRYTDLYFMCYHCASLISTFRATIMLHWSPTLLTTIVLLNTDLTLYVLSLSFTDPSTLCATIELYLSLLYVLPLCHTDLQFMRYHWATMISHFTHYHWATLISTLPSTNELHWSYTLCATIELHWSLLNVLPLSYTDLRL